jgi:phosphate uptake regulator
MDYRKIIKFGNNSHVVSIPQAWIKKYKLSKGDILNLETIGDNIVLSPQKESVSEEKIAIIKINKETNERNIKRELISAYEDNFDTIIFSGKEINKHTKTITQLVESYIALEIVEIGETQLICKTYINSDEVNIDKFAKRIDNSIKTMFSEIIKQFNESDNESVKELDEDLFQRERNIDKIVRMIRRIIKERLYKQQITPQETPLDLLRCWQFIANVERLSDNISHIASIIKDKEEYKRAKKAQQLFKEQISTFSEVLIAYHKKSKVLAEEASDKLKKHSEHIFKEQKDKQFSKVLELIYENKEFIVRINRLSY